MSSLRSKAEQIVRITDALTKLGAARREKLAAADFAVYEDGLIEFPIEVVVTVCAELGRTAPADFQPKFPPLHAIREACFSVVERQQQRRKQLTAAKPEPADPARLQQLLEDCKAEVARKVMR